MRNVRSICLAGFASIAFSSLVMADDPDPDRGMDLAQRWCSECHIIGPSFGGGDAGPTFESVAERPNQTVDAVRAWLAEPHAPMPDFQLTADQYDDLAAHIMSLKE